MLKRLRWLSACLLVVAAPVQAQSTPKAWRLAFLGFEPLPASHAQAFADGLKSFGYVEGSNLVIERRMTGGVNERATALAARRLGIEVYRAAVREPADYDAALKSLAAGAQ